MKRAGEVIAALFDKGLMEQAKGYSAFFSCWQDLMEKNGIPAAGDHSWIQSLDHGLVWIEVDHPGWKQILQTKESKLLYDFRYRFPDMDISGLSIVLCRSGSRPEITASAVTETAAESDPPDIPVTAPAAADNLTPDSGYDAIKGEALQKALMRLEKSILEKEAGNRQI